MFDERGNHNDTERKKSGYFLTNWSTRMPCVVCIYLFKLVGKEGWPKGQFILLYVGVYLDGTDIFGKLCAE